MAAFYNEIDPKAAAVLRQLITNNVIAPGVVDTRSIEDIKPDELRDYTQVHFFAGGGLWSVAARMAGWPDDKPLWTGSCPCQPFSVAGKGLGADDPRHLWPHFRRLVSTCRPPVLVGEQVAGKAGYGWLDGVRADLEREGYASRGVDVPACAVDAPHQRSRLYWIAVAHAEGQQCGPGLREDGAEQDGTEPTDRDGGISVVDPTSLGRREGWPEHELRGGRATAASADAPGVSLLAVADSEGRKGHAERRHAEPSDAGSADGRHGTSWWAGAERLVCHDTKTRRTKPGIPVLVNGLPGRVALWSIAGNAIVPVLAAEVLKAHLETE